MGFLDVLLLLGGQYLCLLKSHQTSLTCNLTDETCHEVLQADGLGGILTKEFVINALNHLLANLLTDVQTKIVSGLLLVVTGIGAFVQSLDELVHVGGINTHAYHVFFQTTSAVHTESIRESVNVTLEVSLWGAVTAGCNDGSDGYHEDKT